MAAKKAKQVTFTLSVTGTEITTYPEFRDVIANSGIGWGFHRLDSLRNQWCDAAEVHLSDAFRLKVREHGVEYNESGLLVILWACPYILTEFSGFGFKLVDSLAMAIDSRNATNPARYNTAAIIMFEGISDTYINLNTYAANMSNLLKITEDAAILALVREAYRPTIMLDLGGVNVIMLRDTYESELTIFNKLKCSLVSSKPSNSPLLQKIIASGKPALDTKGLTLNELQRLALHRAVQLDVSVITGGAGTGKTTSLAIFANYVNKLLNSERACITLAPTGKAAKRFKQAAAEMGFNVFASTIHRVLYGDTKSILGKAEVILIDEMSMVTVQLLGWLLRSINKASSKLGSDNTPAIIFIGDPNQLPPIGSGRPLRDMLAFKQLESFGGITRLLSPQRQAAKSKLYQFLSAIKDRNYNGCSLQQQNDDITFIPSTGDSLADTLRNLVKVKGLTPFNSKVIVPQRKEPWGVDFINPILQDLYNPYGSGVAVAKSVVTKLRKGDIVMWLKNNYKLESAAGVLGVMNGEEFIIGDIEGSKRRIIPVDNQDDFILVDGATLGYDVQLSYATTVHKMQGSQADIIVFVCLEKHSRMLINVCLVS